jgi:mannosyl-oligosaccharide alpha-1,2-mannosidase
MFQKMMMLAWDGYKRFAWGKNELRPMSKTSHTPKVFGEAHDLGVTIIDAMDTLYIMDLRKELAEAVDWVKTKFNMNHVNSRAKSNISHIFIILHLCQIGFGDFAF